MLLLHISLCNCFFVCFTCLCVFCVSGCVLYFVSDVLHVNVCKIARCAQCVWGSFFVLLAFIRNVVNNVARRWLSFFCRCVVLCCICIAVVCYVVLLRCLLVHAYRYRSLFIVLFCYAAAYAGACATALFMLHMWRICVHFSNKIHFNWKVTRSLNLNCRLWGLYACIMSWKDNFVGVLEDLNYWGICVCLSSTCIQTVQKLAKQTRHLHSFYGIVIAYSIQYSKYKYQNQYGTHKQTA